MFFIFNFIFGIIIKFLHSVSSLQTLPNTKTDLLQIHGPVSPSIVIVLYIYVYA